MWKTAKLTAEQEQAMAVARVGFMNHCPFFCYYFYDQMKEVPTLDIPTAATDGRRIWYNPEYLASLKPPERVFVLAHEVYHAIQNHPKRFKHYAKTNDIRGLPFVVYETQSGQVGALINDAADYVINAGLIEENIGVCNPAWLYDPDIKGAELTEDVYAKLYKKLPNPPKPQSGRGSGQSQPGKAPPSSTYGDSQQRKGGKPDPQAQANGGRFDEHLPPSVDPVTGKEDLPDEQEFKEAIAKAAAAAKAMGKMPAGFQRMVDEILEPQVNWREHVRMLLTGRLGQRSETWAKPNRRRLVLNPIVIMPGRRGFGAEDVVCVIDTSGSIGQKELDSFFAEVGGVLQDVRPKRIHVVWCDAAVAGVDVVSSLDDLGHVRANPKGGGGTDFRPPFEWVREQGLKPETLIYLTDMYGTFPDDPGYPVVWCATSDVVGPFGDTVRIEV